MDDLIIRKMFQHCCCGGCSCGRCIVFGWCGYVY